MNASDIEYLMRKFGPVRWVSFGTSNPAEGVYLLTVTPLPPKNEIQAVIADISAGNIPVLVDNGKIYHSDKCQIHNHVIPDKIVRGAIPLLKEETFKVAVYPNIPLGPVAYQPLGGQQPLAIGFQPEITYTQYPDHPHISMGNHEKFLPGTHHTIPDTICYIADPRELGVSLCDRLFAAFNEITIWLLRHQVWVATRELTGKGKWIGPHEGFIEPQYFPLKLNPKGICRCGSKEPYNKCHLSEDLASAKENYGEDYVKEAIKYIANGWFQKVIHAPQKALFDALKKL